MIRIQAICKRKIFMQMASPLLTEKGISVISVCESTPAAIEEYKRNKPPVVLMDANMGTQPFSFSTPQLIEQLRHINPDVKIIVITNSKEDFIIQQLKSYSISGYFYRSMEHVLDAMVSCIRKVEAGQECFVA